MHHKHQGRIYMEDDTKRSANTGIVWMHAVGFLALWNVCTFQPKKRTDFMHVQTLPVWFSLLLSLSLCIKGFVFAFCRRRCHFRSREPSVLAPSVIFSHSTFCSKKVMKCSSFLGWKLLSMTPRRLWDARHVENLQLFSHHVTHKCVSLCLCHLKMNENLPTLFKILTNPERLQKVYDIPGL